MKERYYIQTAFLAGRYIGLGTIGRGAEYGRIVLRDGIIGRTSTAGRMVSPTIVGWTSTAGWCGKMVLQDGQTSFWNCKSSKPLARQVPI